MAACLGVVLLSFKIHFKSSCTDLWALWDSELWIYVFYLNLKTFEFDVILSYIKKKILEWYSSCEYLKATGYFWTSHTALFEQGVIMSETILKPRSPHPPSFSLELWMASAWKAPVVVEEPWRGLLERNNRILGFLCGPTLFSSCRKRDRIQIRTLSLGIKVVSLEESPEMRDEQQSPYSVPLWCSSCGQSCSVPLV